MTFREVIAANPRLRRRVPVAIVHSGGRRTIFNCCLCGARHTCASSYRRAKHVQEFQDYHNEHRCQDKVSQVMYLAGK